MHVDPELTGHIVRAIIMVVATLWALWPMVSEAIKEVRNVK